ncbi:hypothetical protein R5W23_001948 [Gemmata sp. JC673]|uniref:VCBS repeat-containing protein n=1 Tax=Gemmata algarum TaxID=2975278 RepID=A0ABU5F1S2_9BACT|nr:hypothetical protein [Gemmata algarum]MDY3560702.1 hypothetical protein [Gemmata algarum]
MSTPSRPPGSRPARLSVENLEDRTTPTFLARPGGVEQLAVNGVSVPTGGLSIAVGDLIPDFSPSTVFTAQNEYVTGTGPGTLGTVRVWRLDGTVVGNAEPVVSFVPFAGFTGGINVAVGDVTGDGELEIIAAVAGNGPPHVKVFSANGTELGSFYAFDPGFRGGVNIAVGNVLGGIAAGGYPGGTVSQNFKQEIIVGAASGGSPHVVVTDAAGTILRSFLAFDLGYRGGVTVAAGSIDTTQSANFATTGVDTNAYDEIIVGSATSSAHVKAFNVSTGAIVQRLSFFAFDPATSQGVTLAAGSTDGVRGAEIYVGQITPNLGTAPQVKVFDGRGLPELTFTPYPAGYTRVVNMVTGYLTPQSRGLAYYDSEDDDTATFAFLPNGNPDFVLQDLALVTGDGAFFQEPRFYIGLGFNGTPAGGFGP